MQVAPDRVGKYHGTTGIYIRAKDADGKYGTFDIAELDKESLLEFLTKDRDPSWTVDVIGILLGHGHLTIKEEHDD